MNKVIIAGSRHLNNYDYIVDAVKESGFKIDEVISGCANGIDTCGELWAVNEKIPVKTFPAKWNDLKTEPCIIKTNKYGKQYNVLAGHNRNKEMAEYATHLILIWGGKSSGSANMKKLATEKNLIIYEKII